MLINPFWKVLILISEHMQGCAETGCIHFPLVTLYSLKTLDWEL